MYAYGSGLASSIYVLQIRNSLDSIKARINIKEKLNSRIKISTNEYE